MNRRTFLGTLPAIAAVVCDRARRLGRRRRTSEFIRAWERAQTRASARRSRPRARIAPAGEPGVRCVVHGRVFQRDGRTAARRHRRLRVPHRSHRAIYDVPVERARTPGACAAGRRPAPTAASSSTTIRPAPYPGRRDPAHIHVGIQGPGLARFWVPGSCSTTTRW